MITAIAIPTTFIITAAISVSSSLPSLSSSSSVPHGSGMAHDKGTPATTNLAPLRPQEKLRSVMQIFRSSALMAHSEEVVQ